MKAANGYGLPSRVRTDHGMENFHIGITMNIIRGTGRGSIITGESIHNERIERLWRDCYRQVNNKYSQTSENVINLLSYITLFACFSETLEALFWH
jgi:hypothetical protein